MFLKVINNNINVSVTRLPTSCYSTISLIRFLLIILQKDGFCKVLVASLPLHFQQLVGFFIVTAKLKASGAVSEFMFLSTSVFELCLGS